MATLDIYTLTQKIRILLLNLCNYAAVLNIFFLVCFRIIQPMGIPGCV